MGDELAGGDVTDDVDRPGGLPIDPDLPDVVDVFGTAAGERPVRHPSWDVAVVIGLGGAIGGAARWALNDAWPTTPGRFPWSTFAENVSGCFLLGALMVLLLDVRPPSRYARPFLGIGVLGGFTTFSTYTSDTRALLVDGQGALALAYLFGTLLVALAATWLGIALTRSLTGVTPRTKGRRTP